MTILKYDDVFLISLSRLSVQNRHRNKLDRSKRFSYYELQH